MRTFFRIMAMVFVLICLLEVQAYHAQSAPNPPHRDRATSLVHRYSFNDGTASDSVGKADGKLVRGVSIYGGQAHFTGKKGERIELSADGPDGININHFQEVTFEAWYTARDEADEKKKPSMKWQRVFDFGASTGIDSPEGVGSYCVHYVVNSGDITNPGYGNTRAELSNAAPSFADQAIASISPAPLNKEVYIAVVADSSAITLYVNGVRVAEAALGGRTLAKLSNDYALLGGSLYGAHDPSLAGSINELRIYDTALTASQVAANFKAGPNKVHLAGLRSRLADR